MKMTYRILSLLLICTFNLPETRAAEFNPNIFVELSKKVVPSVVNIQTLSKGRQRFSRGAPGGRRPPEEDEGESLPEGSALGTGFIIDASGLILTNNHVVARTSPG